MDTEQQAMFEHVQTAIKSYNNFETSPTTREEIEFLYRECRDIGWDASILEDTPHKFPFDFYSKIEAFKYLIDHNPSIQQFESEQMISLDKAFNQLGLFADDAVSTKQLSHAFLSFNKSPEDMLHFTHMYDRDYRAYPGFAVIREKLDETNAPSVVTDMEIFCNVNAGEVLLLQLNDIPLYSSKTKFSVIITSVENKQGYTLMSKDYSNRIVIDRTTKIANHGSLYDGPHELSMHDTEIVVPSDATKQAFHEGSLSFDAQITNYESTWFGLSETSTTKNIKHTINIKVTNFGVGQ